jgi:hypothetical protein
VPRVPEVPGTGMARVAKSDKVAASRNMLVSIQNPV